MKIAVLLSVLAMGLGGVHAPAGEEWRSLNTSFVTRDGTRLEIDGRPFRFAGTNMYWLGLDENVGGVDYPTYFRIRDALDTAKAMGQTVVRSHMMASTGNPKSIRPSKDSGFNEAAFATIDYAIAYAGSIGIRLVLPMTDEWAYYHGGHRDFTDPYGLPSSAFYTDERVIADYQAYASHILHRTNKLTGVAYNADPTILAWEFGNELEGMTLDWINRNAAKFHEWAPRQLVAAGRRFDIDPDTLAAPGVDIVDVHYYPPTSEKVRADAATITGAGKVYIAGEYGSVSASTELFAPLIGDANVTGMLSWSLFGHNDRHGFVPHNDGFTVHYPGDDARMAATVEAQIAYAKAVSTVPARRLRLDRPLITEIAKQGGLNVLSWRGTAGAVGYRVERSRTGHDRWIPAHTGLLTDNQTPWIDQASPGDVSYRVVPVDRYERRGPASEPVRVEASEVVLIDPVETLTIASASSGVSITASPRQAVARPTGAGPASITWSKPDIREVHFDLVGRDWRGLAVEVSEDGVGWRPVRVNVRGTTLTAKAGGADHVRLVWTGRHAKAGLTRATVWAADPAPVQAAPGAFAVTAPAPGATGVVGPTAYTWGASAGAGFYTLVVSRNADLSNPVLSVPVVPGTTYVPTGALPPSTTFYWKVTATNARGTFAAPVASFTTRALPTTPTTIDDYEGFADSAALAAAYPLNMGGDPMTVTLAPVAGGHAMRLDYTLAAAGYAGAIRTFPAPLDLWGQEGIELWLDPGGNPVSITVQFVTNGVYFEHTLPAGASGVVRIPFSEFKHPPWAASGPLDLLRFNQLSFYVGGSGAGHIVVDNVAAYPAG